MIAGVTDPRSTAERIADRDRPVPDPELVRIAELQIRKVSPLIWITATSLGIGADHLGFEGALIVERDGDVLGVRDDVVVGEDAALGVPMKPEPELGTFCGWRWPAEETPKTTLCGSSESPRCATFCARR